MSVLKALTCMRSVAALVLLAFVSTTMGVADAAPRELRATPAEFRLIPNQSGPVNYYSVVNATPEPYLHSEYQPGLDTAVLGFPVPEGLRRSVQTVRWKWRALKLPRGGDECADGKGDSAAVVYVTWQRGLRWYSLKYVWSSVGKKGAVCDRKSNPFRAQHTIVVDSGGPLSEWRSVEIDPDREFRNHFEGGDPTASVPDFVGVAVMSDGDQTHSPSSADFAGFTFTLRGEK